MDTHWSWSYIIAANGCAGLYNLIALLLCSMFRVGYNETLDVYYFVKLYFIYHIIIITFI